MIYSNPGYFLKGNPDAKSKMPVYYSMILNELNLVNETCLQFDYKVIGYDDATLKYLISDKEVPSPLLTIKIARNTAGWQQFKQTVPKMETKQNLELRLEGNNFKTVVISKFTVKDGRCNPNFAMNGTIYIIGFAVGGLFGGLFVLYSVFLRRNLKKRTVEEVG